MRKVFWYRALTSYIIPAFRMDKFQVARYASIISEKIFDTFCGRVRYAVTDLFIQNNVMYPRFSISIDVDYFVMILSDNTTMNP